ncbi:hypothetical protein [Nocardia rosealba]|uniref:hypothetical protein n=1 Tax=Nocardia rosealba TaxID=2878563 RepID=UPI001CDA0FD8|nr:hypothetical protein [Nocardia rosealba]MCA2210305.1 hypothetical protein [Nocardia rosealba]
MRSTTVLALLVISPVALGACGFSGDHPGKPAMSTAVLWDPCTAVSAELLRRMHVDPETKTSTATSRDDWKYCTWHD